MNPWQMQHKLMEISGQEIPTMYQVNKTSILYAALVLEEVSELMEGLEKIMLNSSGDQLSNMFNIIRSIRQLSHDHSLEIRDELKVLPTFHIDLTSDEAIELADATTDITVVNCGFAVASGIDGNACYQDVAGSNLSKANPDTGIIDKDKSGKWIKGIAYKEPNLVAVMYK
jgi:predicted HAD superfamily Cof-like phosphohydrolase